MQHIGIVHADLHIRSWVAAHQIRWLNHALTVVTDVVSPPVEILAVLVYFWRWRRPQLAPAAVVVLGTQAVVIVMKALVARLTPIHHSMFYGDYPSGHTAMLLTCAGTVLITGGITATRIRTAWITTAIATPVMMVMLIYTQGHWLSDTLASVGLAAVALWLLAVTTTGR